MKRATSIETNAGIQDVLIGWNANYVKKADRTPEWVDEKAGIVTFKRCASEVTIIYDDGKSVTKIVIMPYSILELARIINEINQETFEDIID